MATSPCPFNPLRDNSLATVAGRSFRGEDELEPIRVLQPEDAHAPRHVGGLGLERAAGAGDALREVVDALRRRELERESLALLSIEALRAIVLVDQDPHAAGLERHGDELPRALVLLIDGEADDVAVPGEALLEILHGERRIQGRGAE